MKIYNKLVRDNIPEIIKSNNEICEISILNDEDYKFELNKKLQEEMKEYLESQDIEELADLQEVIFAILEVNGCSQEQFDKLRLAKVDKNGAFKKRVFLKSVYDK